MPGGKRAKPSADRRRWRELSASERIAYANKLIILHPRFREGVDLLARCHLDSRQSREPNCGAILGASGVGKTSVVDHYLRQHPSEETDTCTRQPVLTRGTSAPARTRLGGAQLLSFWVPTKYRCPTPL